MISKAPARICLFGDHQDYLGLPVIACAIDKYIIVEGKPNHSNFLNPLNKLWMQLGMFLGNIISPVVMAVIFFGIVQTLLMKCY